jgi:hypothetical protein
MPQPRLSYANVMATIAVFLALGGAATAALTVPKKSVGAKQLQTDAVTNPKVADNAINSPELNNNAVTNSKVANNAISTGKLANGAVTAGKLAAGVALRNVVVKEVVGANLGNNSFTGAKIICDNGQKALAGGAVITPAGSRALAEVEDGTSMRALTPIDANGNAVANGQTPAGFLVTVQNVSGSTGDFHGYAICATL